MPVGIDVDSAINSSVGVTSNTTGFFIPFRCKTCEDTTNKKDTSKIAQLLRFLKQDCNADLASQVERWKGFKRSGLLTLL